MRVLTLLAVAAVCAAQQPETAREWLNRGVAAFKGARYDEAVAYFQKAVDLDPGFTTAHLYLGTAYMQQYIPGAESPENRANADRAEAEFRAVLAIDAANKVALTSLGSLALHQKKWEDARTWNRQLLSVDPQNADAYYSLAFIDWSQWYPAYAAARTRAGLQPQDPGPIADAAIRADLRSRWLPAVDDGIWNLTRALELNPKFDDAMAYMNLFVRERADLKNTRQEYLQDVAEADQWVQRALAAKAEKASAGVTRGVASPPPPPPPPAGSGSGEARIRITSSVQEQNLVSQTPPVYPPLARQARIQGTVRFGAVVGKDGNILNLEVISGHPLLVPAALDAVKTWRYRPTLLNGQPVEVATEINVTFTLE
jgi:TonB family protein